MDKTAKVEAAAAANGEGAPREIDGGERDVREEGAAGATAPAALPSSPLLLRPPRAVIVGGFARLVAAWAFPLAMDGGKLVPGVSYTDIDYRVFSDAAHYVRRGQSPYQRHTYRYTPFLAAAMAKLLPFGPNAGRYLFCAADAACGWIILELRRRRRAVAAERLRRKAPAHPSQFQPFPSPELQDALWWLYNPLAINLCTRGSAESLLVLLPVLLTLWIATSSGRGGGDNADRRTARRCAAAAAAGIVHGVAVHAKLYPIIYTLSYVAYLAGPPPSPPSKRWSDAPGGAAGALRLLLRWGKRLLTSPAAWLFVIASAATFAGLAILAFEQYGPKAWDEGIAYHLSRLDHRHNYSPHWYWIYLAKAHAHSKVYGNAQAGGIGVWIAGGALSSGTAGRAVLLLLPQALLLLCSSLGLAPHDLSLALFVQTFLFVAHNRVITAQYFSWYLSLLPLCGTGGRSALAPWSDPAVRNSLLALLMSVGLWLACAYQLEMRNQPAHRAVWASSLAFFASHVALLRALLRRPAGGNNGDRNGEQEGDEGESVALLRPSAHGAKPHAD